MKNLRIYFYTSAIFLFLFSCRKDIDFVQSSFESKEAKLINGSWNLTSSLKNGTAISVSSCSYMSSAVYFEEHGEISIGCPMLSQGNGSYGTWEFTNHKKSIHVVLTDSINQTQHIVPITPPTIVTWEVLALGKNIFRIEEHRGNDIYEFDFKNVY